MTNPNKTLIALLLDRSGSMQSITDDVSGAFTSFMVTQQDATTADEEVVVSLYQFDSQNPDEVVYELKPLGEVRSLELEPRGGTPLYDAIGRTVTRVGEQLAGLHESQRPGKVYFVIMTDGQENMSTEWDLAGVTSLLNRQTDQWNWQIHFIGVGVEAWKSMQTIAVRTPGMQTNSATRSSAGLRRSYGAVAQSIVDHRTKP